MGGLRKSDIERVVDSKGGVRFVGKKKRASAKASFKTNTFMQAAKAAGYLRKGEFRPLPKKGTRDYLAIKTLAASM